MSKTAQSSRLFKSDFLERFSHVHPITPLVIWVPVIAWMIWRSFAIHELAFSTVAVIAVAALLFWSLAEYFLHRFVFHMGEDETEGLLYKFHFMIHGIHHSEPNDPTRLVMPPFPAVCLATIFYFLFNAVLGQPYADPFFAFFLVGYLCYDYTHYAVHHFRPRTRLGKYLKQSHMLHHYAEPETRWGVSTPIWDYVFGTIHPKTKPQVSAKAGTARTEFLAKPSRATPRENRIEADTPSIESTT